MLLLGRTVASASVQEPRERLLVQTRILTTRSAEHGDIFAFSGQEGDCKFVLANRTVCLSHGIARMEPVSIECTVGMSHQEPRQDEAHLECQRYT